MGCGRLLLYGSFAGCAALRVHVQAAAFHFFQEVSVVLCIHIPVYTSAYRIHPSSNLVGAHARKQLAHLTAAITMYM